MAVSYQDSDDRGRVSIQAHYPSGNTALTSARPAHTAFAGREPQIGGRPRKDQDPCHDPTAPATIKPAYQGGRMPGLTFAAPATVEEVVRALATAAGIAKPLAG